MTSSNKSDPPVNNKQLAHYFGLSHTRIVQLSNDGVLDRIKGTTKYDLKDSIQSYVAFIKESSSGSSSEKEAKARKEIANAEIQEMKLQTMKDELVSIEEVCGVVASEYSKVRTALISSPSRVAKQLAGMEDPGEIQQFLLDTNNEILEFLSTDEVYSDRAAETAKKNSKAKSKASAKNKSA